MNCVNHPEVPPIAYCRTCGKALCEMCKRDVRGVIYCEDCLAAHIVADIVHGGTSQHLRVSFPLAARRAVCSVDTR